MAHVLGIDGGGTKTICVLMDQFGTVLSRGEGGPGNYQSVGVEVVSTSIQIAIATCLENYPHVPITGVCLGLAGVGRSEDVQVIEKLWQSLPSTIAGNWYLGADSVRICSDSAIALVGGLGHGAGIVAIAGTGSQVFGRNPLGKTKRTGGWGYLLGDEGSAYYIAIRGLQAVLRSDDGRLSPTQLSQCLQQKLGLNTLADLIPLVYRSGWGVKEIAALAPFVDQVAAQGDPVAIEIINSAVAELVLAVKVVITDLFERSETLTIVTSGRVWYSLANLRDRFITSIRAIAPLAQVIWPINEPAYGAGLIALQKIF